MALGGCVIERLLPPAAVAVEARQDPPDVFLFPAEEAAIQTSVEKRRLEFTTTRQCAREAFARLGLPPSPVVSGQRGEPRWPSGVVGSITHCDGYRACAVARLTDVVTIGIDAEPHAALPAGVVSAIAGSEELGWVRDLKRQAPAVHWDRLLFSAKESVYKAWFPLAERWLGFEDAVVTVDPSACTFSARLLVAGPMIAGEQLAELSGRWLVRDGLVLTAIAVVGRGVS